LIIHRLKQDKSSTEYCAYKREKREKHYDQHDSLNNKYSRQEES